MIPRKTAAAASRRWLRRPLAALLAAAATGLLLAVLPQPARAATGDFEIGAGVGADRAAYLVRGGLQTCDSTNNCTGGLTQPKTVATSAGFGNTILQIDTGNPDSGFRGTISFQLSGLPAGVTSQTPASTTITNSTILGTDGYISASLNGQTMTAQLTILDQIGPGTSQTFGNWGKHDHVLTVTAVTNNPSDTLQVFAPGSTQLIGTLTNLGQGNYQGQFPWPVNPGYVDIKSSGGATLTIPIPTVNQ